MGKKAFTLTRKQKSYFKIKSFIDIAIGCVCFLIFAPLFFLIAIAIKIEDGFRAPVFFVQKRVGINQKHFNMYKFRSMSLNTPHDRPTHLLENPEQYITKVGRVIRKFSLDELPQLLNIIKGDMSFIGPRPALWNQEDLIALREEYGVHQLKPGLSGYAQITGRDELTIEEKAHQDYIYLKEFGVKMDSRCFWGTFAVIINAQGVVEGGKKK